MTTALEEIKKLQEENESIRSRLKEFVSSDKTEQEKFWLLISDLVENELNQEELCD